MYANHWQSRTFSFAVSAMLTSAVLATAPNPSFITAASATLPDLLLKVGYTAPAPEGLNIPEPTAVAVALGTTPKKLPALTPRQLKTILEILSGSDGYSEVVLPTMARIHNLNANETKLRSLTWTSPENEYYGIGLTGHSDYIFSKQNTRGNFSFRVGPDFGLISAAYVTNKDFAHPQALQYSDAEGRCLEVLQVWARVANENSPDSVASR